jgi:hypothetical protein
MLTTHHEVAHASRPKNRRRRAEQRRGDIDAERLGGLQVDARPGAIRLDVSVGSKAPLTERPVLADCVEKVENRGAPKISRMSNVGDLSRSKALQYRCERRWGLLR